MKSTNGGAVEFLGTSDEVTSCDCCGRKDLKSTVALVVGDGDTVYFGVVCAARSLAMSAKDVKAAAKNADDDRTKAQRVADEERRRFEDKCWQDFLDTKAPALKGRRFEQIQALGGFAAARQGYTGSL
jgi:hypothetical protein